MKRGGRVANALTPDGAVENAFSSSLATGEKQTGVDVVVARDAVRSVRHRGSLAGSAPAPERRPEPAGLQEIGLEDFREAM
jgi:hypothetical protein